MSLEIIRWKGPVSAVYNRKRVIIRGNNSIEAFFEKLDEANKTNKMNELLEHLEHLELKVSVNIKYILSKKMIN